MPLDVCLRLRQVPDFNVNQRAFVIRIRRMFALVGIANPATRRVLAMFVVERTFDHEDLLAAPVGMQLELRLWRPNVCTSMQTCDWNHSP